MIANAGDRRFIYGTTECGEFMTTLLEKCRRRGLTMSQTQLIFRLLVKPSSKQEVAAMTAMTLTAASEAIRTLRDIGDIEIAYYKTIKGNRVCFYRLTDQGLSNLE